MATQTNGHRHGPSTTGRTIGWWAPFYDVLSWFMSFGRLTGIRRETLGVAELKPGESLLDVGCGTGSLTLRAAKEVAPRGRAAGIDASPQMVATARRKARRAPGIEFRVAPIEQLPFEAAEFDVVLSSLMFHHLPDDVKKLGLDEVRRVLKPGGRLIVVDLGKAKGLLGHVGGHQLPVDYAERLQSLATAAGFNPVELVRTKYSDLLFMRAVAPGT